MTEKLLKFVDINQENPSKRDKIERKFDLIVDIFGADHADTYPDVLSALNALDIDTEHVKILIYQFVTLIKNGEKVKIKGYLEDFALTKQEADNLIMSARKIIYKD